MSKTQLVDGLWKRTTRYGKHTINLTIYRTPYHWNAIAETSCGRVECGGSDPLQVAKNALINLRLNIHIWSNWKRGVCYI